ncbi:MAG TPA: alpha/beta hydrolase [Fimbriiglobus sp.]|nr:alpha/beta hydrolase [Fimbriiglobus sp.]
MGAARIFRSDEAKARLDGWYDRFLAKVPGPVERREVPTSQGPSHVLLAGDPANPPLVCYHGSLASSAHLLSELALLAPRYRLIGLDLPGQSVKGPPVRMNYKDDSLGKWAVEVIDGLGVDKCDLLGVSWGGFAARVTASVVPDRVKKLALLVPAGVVTGPVWKGITQMAIPLTLYKLFPSERRKRRFFTPLFTTWDDDWADYMGDAFRDFVLVLRIPPVATDAELRGLTMPVLVIGAGQDVSFPGEKLLSRVKAVVPSVETELLADSKHSPPFTPTFRGWLADRVTRFLGGVAGELPASLGADGG